MALDTVLRAKVLDLLKRDADFRDEARQHLLTAELVVEARNADGSPCYVAVEASYTADRRDSDRVLRNAGFLARCTGRPAHAVVACLRNDRDVQALVD